MPSIRAGQIPLGHQSFLDYRSGQTVLHVGAADQIRLRPEGSAVQMTVNDRQQLRLGPEEWPHLLLEGHRGNVSIAPELAPTFGSQAAGETPEVGPGPVSGGGPEATDFGATARETVPASLSAATREGGKSLRHMLLEQLPPSPSFRRMEDLVAPLARQLNLEHVPMPRHSAELTEFLPVMENRLAQTPAASKGALLGDLLAAGPEAGRETGGQARRLVGPEQRELAGRVLLSAQSTADFRGMLEAMPNPAGLAHAMHGDETFALLCGAAGVSVTPEGIQMESPNAPGTMDAGRRGEGQPVDTPAGRRTTATTGAGKELMGVVMGRRGAAAGLNVRQMVAARQELGAWSVSPQTAGDAVRLLESPAALVMSTPAEKGELLRTLAGRYTTPGDERALVGGLASAPDPAAFTEMLQAGGWDQSGPTFKDGPAHELFQQLAGAFGQPDLAADPTLAASTKDILTGGLAGTGGLPEGPGGDPFRTGGILRHPAALGQDPRLLGEGLGRPLSRAISLQDPRSLNLAVLAGSKSLTGGEISLRALPELRGMLLRGLGEMAMPPELHPLLTQLGTALPAELQAAPDGLPPLPVAFLTAQADPEHAWTVLSQSVAEQGAGAGFDDFGLRQAVVQPLQEAVHSLRQDLQALIGQLRQSSATPAAATSSPDLETLSQGV
ncbi:MAG: hypothetical protein JXQ27_16375, partial [Acidobacteria bacterium]|nr:hypothetical protein [Acidobacteriota bacterium]